MLLLCYATVWLLFICCSMLLMLLLCACACLCSCYCWLCCVSIACVMKHDIVEG